MKSHNKQSFAFIDLVGFADKGVIYYEKDRFLLNRHNAINSLHLTNSR